MSHIQRFLRHVQLVTTSWRRVLLLVWKAGPQYVVLLLALTCITGLIPSLQIQITSHIVQSAADAIRGGRTSQFVSVAVFFGMAQGGITIISLVLSSIQQFLQTLLQLRLANHISIHIMEKAVALDVQHFEDDVLYDTLQRANRESMYRPYQIFAQMVSLCSQCVTLISVVAVLLSWSWWLGLLILLAPLPAVYSQVFYSQRGYAIERNRSSDRRRLMYLQFLVTNARAVKEIRLFHLGTHFLERYRTLNNSFYKTDSNLLKQQLLMSTPLNILSSVVSAGAQVYAIITTIALGRIGLLAGYIQAIWVVQSTMQSLLGGLTQLYQNNLFISSLFEFLDIPPSRIRGGKRAVPDRLQKGIEFRHVSFRYPGTTQVVIRDLNLFLQAGECVALVGHNGAGKTTLVKLLSRLYEPTEGQILIDDVPIEEYDLLDLRKRISVIFQDFIQYEMTARENIGFGYVEELGNDERIQAAAEKSGAAPIIQSLPQGNETPLGRMFEKGHELSIGQWQKIALARAFMRRAPIVVLDEPTSAIDPEAEVELFSRLQQIAAGATTLLIAHRFSTVRMADRIIVLDKGQIIEDGDHETLMRFDGTYAHLFNLQAAGYAHR
ncbi:MAG: ABC transporter ATP-binding protein [Ktedonobacteraceae bacterium]|nr:ABC transporter ATP-binding protein [Ktedonobacteraceae bacterium]